MKKLLFVNLNVGSAIEQSGNEVISWIKELKEINTSIYNIQTCEEHFFNFLQEKKPEIVIINSTYPRIVTPLFFYKLQYPDTKIIIITRTETEILNCYQKTDNISLTHYNRRLELLLNKSEKIICVNLCNKIKKIFKEDIRRKIIDCCGINNEGVYDIKIPWNQRKKNFVILGSLNPHKLSENFINLITETNIEIDCYGNIDNQPQNYQEKFLNCKNLNYLGKIEYWEVPNILNQYRYYVLPHNGHEPLCNSMQQAILCGCIPLMSDNWEKQFWEDKHWSNWGNNLIFKAVNDDALINNLKEIEFYNSDYQIMANHLRELFINKYSTLKLKQKLLKEIKQFL